MATTKKPAMKKAPAKKPAIKAASAKKAPVKKAVAKASAKKAPSSQLRSFRISKSEQPFTTFKITKQTVYWIILVAFIMFAQLWILKLQVEVASLLEMQQAELLEEF